MDNTLTDEGISEVVNGAKQQVDVANVQELTEAQKEEIER